MSAFSGPFTAPVHNGPFIGRTQALERVAQGLLSGRPVVVSGRRGQPGVGKMALASMICAAAGDNYGGPVVWLPGPMPDPSLILTRLSLALGQGPQVAKGRRYARHISELLRSHRALVVLDRVEVEHASYFEQGTPLLVLTREANGVEALNGLSVELDCFSRQETQALLTAHFVDASTHVLAELERMAVALEFHPQSLSMALGIVNALGLDAVVEVKKRLVPRLRRLEGYPTARRGVVAVFSVMCELLTPESRAQVLSLGALPTSGFDFALLGTALGASSSESRDLLGHWLSLGLIQALGGSRYRVRGLVGDLARGMSELHSERLKVARYFLGICQQPRSQGAGIEVDMEAITQSVAYVMERGERRLVVDFVRSLAPTHDDMLYRHEAAQRFQWALASAQGLKDKIAEGEVRYWMGRYHFREGGDERELACRQLSSARQLFESENEANWELRVLESLSEFQVQLGDRSGAIESYERICYLQGLESVGSAPRLQGERLLRLGQLLAQVGRERAAFVRLKQAEALVWHLHDTPKLVESVADAIEAVALRLQIQHPFEIPLEQDYEEMEAMQASLETNAKVEQAPETKAAHFFTGYQPFRLSLSDGRVLDPFNRDDLAEMLTAHRKGLTEAAKVGDVHRQAAHDEAIAQIAALQGELRRAMSHFRRAIRRHRQCEHLPAVAAVLQQMGDLSLRGGDSEDAMCHYVEGLQIYESLGDESGRAALLCKLGRLYLMRGEVKTASEHLEYSEFIFAQLEDETGCCGASLLRAVCLIREDRGEEALAMAEQALEKAMSLESPQLVAAAEKELARICLLQGHESDGLQHLRRAAHLNHASADIEALSETFLILGQLHGQSGHGTAAISYHRRLGELARALNLADIEASSSAALADVLSARGEWGEARGQLNKAIELRLASGHGTQAGELELKLAEVYLQEGDVEQGILAVNSALDRLSGDVTSEAKSKAQYLQGVALAMLGQVSAAEELLGEAARNNAPPKASAACLLLMGQLKVCSGQLEAAQELWLEAAEVLGRWDGESAELLKNRAQALPI